MNEIQRQPGCPSGSKGAPPGRGHFQEFRFVLDLQPIMGQLLLGASEEGAGGRGPPVWDAGDGKPDCFIF